MSAENHEPIACQVCGQSLPRDSMIEGGTLRRAVADMMRRDVPSFEPERFVCPSCNARYRSDYVRSLIAEDHGELSSLDEEVIEALRDEDLLVANINEEFAEQLTFGQRLADSVARFGGSWAFILVFGFIILAWMAVNAGILMSRPFDPYPFILLNLVLSTLAALQAPVIMMSQNRQASKDRMEADHDYRVNLKAELEIRLMHTKLDQLLRDQWRRLIEIQQLQMDLMEEIGKAQGGGRPA